MEMVPSDSMIDEISIYDMQRIQNLGMEWDTERQKMESSHEISTSTGVSPPKGELWIRN